MRATLVSVSAFLLISIITVPASAFADNSMCWGNGADDRSRPEITCRPLTEELLLSLRNATRAEVVKAMNAQGRDVEIGLHYLSNAPTYSGYANFSFEGDRVTIINAIISPADGSKNLDFIWNAHVQGCSDFSGSRNRCND